MDGRNEELETLWRLRLEDARERHERAKENCRNIRAEFAKELSSDGQFVLRQALKHEAIAGQEHARVLRIFTDLILYGKKPRE